MIWEGAALMICLNTTYFHGLSQILRQLNLTVSSSAITKTLETLGSLLVQSIQKGLNKFTRGIERARNLTKLKASYSALFTQILR